MNEQMEIDFDAVEKEIKKIAKEKKPEIGEPFNITTRLIEFKNKLNQKPPPSFLKKNPYYGNMYIPLEIIERTLSALFHSYNFIINKDPIIAEGNIIFMVDVIVVNPITKEEEMYTGVSAVPIKPINGTLRDVHPHIPAAKSYAIMNACKHIGRLFRAENDNITNVFDTYFEKKLENAEISEEEKAKQNKKDRLLKMIKYKRSIESLKKLGESVDELDDKEVIEAYNEKFEKLNNKKKK
jgi:hypothetical protein